MIKINVHSSLARFTNNQTQLQLSVDNTRHLIPALSEHHPRLHTHIVDESGELSPFVNIYINGKNLKTLTNEPHTLNSKDTVDIITALVGG